MRRHAIRAVVPFNDRDQVLLAGARQAFADAGAVVIASDAEVSDRTCDKYAAYRFFVEHDIPTPRTWLPDELPAAADIRFPVLVKARRGFGSRDIYRAHPSCSCILLIRQDRLEITVDSRSGDGWGSQILQGTDDLVFRLLRLSCSVKDVYRDTPLG